MAFPLPPVRTPWAGPAGGSALNSPGLSPGAWLLQLPPSPLLPARGPGREEAPREATRQLPALRPAPLLSIGWDSLPDQVRPGGWARALSLDGPMLAEREGGNWGHAAPPRGLPAPGKVPRGPNVVSASRATLGNCVAGLLRPR